MFGCCFRFDADRAISVDRDGDVIPGDIILALNGGTVDSVAKLLAQLDEYHIGDRVTLRIWRAGREMEIAVTLQAGG